MIKESKLKAKLCEKEIDIAVLAKKIGISRVTFYRKMKNDSFFVSEVDSIARALELSSDEITAIFFAERGA